MTEIIARFRQLDGGARVVERTLLTALAVVGGLWATQVHHYLPFAFFNEQYLGVFLALGLAPVFVCVRAGGAASLDRVPWYDWLLTAGALVVGGYVAVFYPTIAYTLGIITTHHYSAAHDSRENAAFRKAYAEANGAGCGSDQERPRSFE